MMTITIIMGKRNGTQSIIYASNNNYYAQQKLMEIIEGGEWSDVKVFEYTLDDFYLE